MNLTEPQAGSDLSAVRTRAVREGDHYRIQGTKIFITWGEHDMTENIVHLVLARTPDAPEGVKGISLFIVPKFLPEPDGTPGERNDVRCVSIEHKLGIHASPTCVLAYGDQKGAIGYLVGEENRGLEYMFTMMNHARLAVGVEGVAIGERAYQHALEYAKTRVQGREIGQRSGDRVTIIHHPDVRRMLMSMRAQTEAMRALAYFAAATLDKAQAPSRSRGEAAQPGAARSPDADRQGLVHGAGRGDRLDRHPGARRHGLRRGDRRRAVPARCAHHHDLRRHDRHPGERSHRPQGRVREGRDRAGGDRGDAAARRAARRRAESELASLRAQPEGSRGRPRGRDALAGRDLSRRTRRRRPAVSVPYLKLFGTVAGGWMMARAALVAQAEVEGSPDADRDFLEAKLATARFYAEHELPQGAYRSRAR